MPAAEWWTDTSYDYLFRFGARSPTNNVVIIFMDNAAYSALLQARHPNAHWDRGLHAQLLNKLADDGCPLVVFDVFFSQNLVSPSDADLLRAIGRQKGLVLMADLANPAIASQGAQLHSLNGVHPVLPALAFVKAAKGNCGVAYFDPDADSIVRRHWPFPAGHSEMASLSSKAAEVFGANWEGDPEWLRYYNSAGAGAAWTSLSYHIALQKTPGYFRDKIVFIGNQPATASPFDVEKDEFVTPFQRWERPLKSVGGVELHATAFLNLVNHEWLRSLPLYLQLLLIVGLGALVGGLLPHFPAGFAAACAAAAMLIVSLGAVCFSYYTNYWFFWLIPAGAQVPCALAVSLICARVKFEKSRTRTHVVTLPAPGERPETIDYELADAPFAEGAYGKVWLAKNAVGQWQALKTVYRAGFRSGPEPYDREFSGIRRYKPISDKHPGLLRVEFVSANHEKGYFYYVMELGDSLNPDWQQNPITYFPRDLAAVRAESADRRLPFNECVRIGLALCDALEFLHVNGLTHRDIKPSNVLFVKGQPKLADVGLVSEIRPDQAELTLVGTPHYMPPPPESPGTPQADIYALGKVLYVILSGRDPEKFPELGETLVENTPREQFLAFNSIILKACQPERDKRYSTVAEMGRDLQLIVNSRNSLGPMGDAPKIGL